MEQDIYKTREELKKAEDGIVNWDKWDELVKKTKKDIAKALKNYTPPNKRKQIYVYTLTSKLPLFIFDDSDKASSTLGIDRMVITNYCNTYKPFYKRGLIFSYKPLF